MAEYIKREALMAEYDRQHTGEPGRARKLIEEAPAEDVAPVVRGVWKTGFIDKQNKTTGVECSECNAYFELDLFDFGLCYNYCPNCGARMDGE